MLLAEGCPACWPFATRRLYWLCLSSIACLFSCLNSRNIVLLEQDSEGPWFIYIIISQYQVSDMRFTLKHNNENNISLDLWYEIRTRTSLISYRIFAHRMILTRLAVVSTADTTCGTATGILPWRCRGLHQTRYISSFSPFTLRCHLLRFVNDCFKFHFWGILV